MNVIYFNQFGGLIQDLTMKGNTLEGELILIRDPLEPNEAATKSYTDTVFSNLNTMLIVSGNFTASQMPALSGDASSLSGTTLTYLPNRGFSETPQTKVTVNSKGIVEALGGLSANDYPSLDWSKIMNLQGVSGVFEYDLTPPTSFAGYGITDAIDTNGGNLIGNLKLWRHPVGGTEAATKGYTDGQAAASNTGAAVGSLIFKPTENTPTGYLRCNGASVTITTYQSLFDTIGHVTGTNPGGGNFYLPNLTDRSFLGYNYYIKY
ncbi:tail fiber protein [Flavobacterium sp.]|jgi:hypothetical protein|uniref:tail fiber protein n=1 Tax=Flavobacterium sp. TaxID=239 RepID=UPI0037C0AD32